MCSCRLLFSQRAPAEPGSPEYRCSVRAGALRSVRSVCGEMRLVIGDVAAAWQARLSWRVDIGSIGSRPGNSQTCGRAMRHQSRKSSSNCGRASRDDPCRPCLARREHHARAVDIRDFERDHFGDAQAGAVGDASAALCLTPAPIEQARNLLWPEDDRQLARLVDKGQMPGRHRPDRASRRKRTATP